MRKPWSSLPVGPEIVLVVLMKRWWILADGASPFRLSILFSHTSFPASLHVSLPWISMKTKLCQSPWKQCGRQRETSVGFAVCV